MEIKSFAKRYTPKWLLSQYHKLWETRHRRQLLASMPASARHLYRLSALTTYDHIRLSPSDESVRARVMAAAAEHYGEHWNYYSDALRPEIVQGFVHSIDSLRPHFPRVNYLEIGSCQGLSMSLIGLLLRERGMLGSLVSVDPYYESGYTENGPYNAGMHVQVNKKTRDHAQHLYSTLSLPVELHELTSMEGLSVLIGAKQYFELIYIDGSHEALWPVTDFGMSLAVLSHGGVLVLDDHLWPDVQPVKRLCDEHATKVQETWKTVSYRLFK